MVGNSFEENHVARDFGLWSYCWWRKSSTVVETIVIGVVIVAVVIVVIAVVVIVGHNCWASKNFEKNYLGRESKKCD